MCQEMKARRSNYLEGEKRVIEVILADKSLTVWEDRARVDCIGNVCLRFELRAGVTPDLMYPRTLSVAKGTIGDAVAGMCLGTRPDHYPFCYTVVFANNERGEYTSKQVIQMRRVFVQASETRGLKPIQVSI